MVYCASHQGGITHGTCTVHHLTAGEAETALAAEGHPFLFQTMRAQIRRIAHLRGATAEHLLDNGLHVAILVSRMALLEGPPEIAEDLLEGVFVDPLHCGGHSAGLYHVLAPRSTRLCTLIRPALPIGSPCRDEQKGRFSKRKFFLCCRCCQAPFPIFSFPHFFS
jgi:hypothetical protein